MSSRNFPFLTNHGRVLSHLAASPKSTARQIADALGITDRTAYAIISDLVQAGYISRRKVGRQNVYRLRIRFLTDGGPDRDSAVDELSRVLRNRRVKELAQVG
jgi:DNA-binding IclR family transcriptional regulator